MIEGQPPDDGRQPAVEVLDGVRVRALEPQPRLLDDVLRLTEIAELAVGEPQQPRACPRESLGGGHAAIRLQLSVPARMRGAQPVASLSRRLDTRCERARGPPCGGPGAQRFDPDDGGDRGIDLGVRRRLGVGDVVGPGRSAQRRDDRRGRVVEPDRRLVGVGWAGRDRDSSARGLERSLAGLAVGSEEQPEAQHHRVAVEQLAGVALRGQRGRRHTAAGDRRLLVEPGVTAVGVHERDRLLHEPPDVSDLRGARDRRRRMGAQAVVLLPGGRIAHALGARDVRQQVHDGVRAVERAAQRRLVEDVSLDGARPEALELLATASRARHARDGVAGGEQLTDGSPPDDARGSGDHDLVHASLTTYPTES